MYVMYLIIDIDIYIISYIVYYIIYMHMSLKFVVLWLSKKLFADRCEFFTHVLQGCFIVLHYDCPYSSEVTMKYMGRIDLQQHITIHKPCEFFLGVCF